jgi:uncharacterized cupin superfamily protein
VVPEASLEKSDGGVRPVGEGWYVLNVRDAPWFTSELDTYAVLEPEEPRFDMVGVGIGILVAGRSNGMYHGEDAQEDFLVLSGECLLLVEGQERRVRAWDFVHCPPWTEHIFVGVGDEPCVVMGVGARRKGRGIVYPRNETALKHDAGVEETTSDPRVAYARFAEDIPVSGHDVFPPG